MVGVRNRTLCGPLQGERATLHYCLLLESSDKSLHSNKFKSWAKLDDYLEIYKEKHSPNAKKKENLFFLDFPRTETIIK